MTTSLQRHLLLKLSKAQTLGEKGFTLIELLVVIIIIGILAAVALPSLLAQTDKARASEAKSTIGAILRAQQAYYIEHNSFANSDALLGTGSPTNNFSYGINATTTAAGIGNSSGINCTGTITAPNATAAVGNFSISTIACSKNGASL